MLIALSIHVLLELSVFYHHHEENEASYAVWLSCSKYVNQQCMLAQARPEMRNHLTSSVLEPPLTDTTNCSDASRFSISTNATYFHSMKLLFFEKEKPAACQLHLTMNWVGVGGGGGGGGLICL